MSALKDTRCAVLGAGGFLGTTLCQRLRGQTAALRAFGRRQSFPDALRGIEWLTGDFADIQHVKEAIHGCDTVFHLANATTPASANQDKIADLQSNVASTLGLLDACRDLGIKRIIFISSGGTIYGLPKQVPTPESAPTMPITAYGISKLSIEKYLALYEYLHGIEYRVLRVANPFGPYQTAIKSQGAIAAFMQRCLDDAPLQIWGDGSVVRDYIYADDVIDALIQAVKHEGTSRVFNVGAGHGRSLLDIIQAIESVSGRSLAVEFLPKRDMDVPCSVLDTSLAAQELGWHAKTPFPEGIRQTWAWISNRHLIKHHS
ncbi:NAD-dependent epimerase/dehydratase family protein [Achromobacter sp. AONIH1]|uniref:NAD-dependent epimerase/dehydratase family protein n=1 Tax=Achromobacter sp. AONIH1 TaxID=1758194 RepID=UPI00131A1489|nr:NAD-dependent epimerase/dehydratase family protein [Achromobacter sp. AONIH1]